MMKKTIPANWVHAQLNELIAFAIGGDWGKDPTHDDPDYTSVYCIRGSELKNWDKNKGNTASLRKIKKSSLITRTLKQGDILLEISGGGPEQPVGRTALIDKTVLSFDAGIPKICTNFIRQLRPHSQINSSYLNYYLLFFYKSGEIVRYQAGSNNLRNLKFDQYLSITVPIPPTHEQKRIVDNIEELFSELDNGVKSLKTAREQLRIYRQAVLKCAFEGKLIGNYKRRVVSFGQLTNLVTSGSRGWAKYYSETGDLFIRAQNLKYDRLDLAEKAYVSLPNNTEGTRTLVQKNDLLITITGANVTKAALIEKDLGTAYVSQHVALCRPTEEVYPKYLYWFIIAEAAGRKQLNKAAYGAGKPGLNLDNIKSVQITIPSYQEQEAVVEAIEEKLTTCEKFEQNIVRAISESEALRQSILRKAFSGKLVAQDSNDEPASVLLERIQAEKITFQTNNKSNHQQKVKPVNEYTQSFLIPETAV